MTFKHLPTSPVTGLRKECSGVFPWRELWWEFYSQTHKHPRWEKHSPTISGQKRNFKESGQSIKYMQQSAERQSQLSEKFKRWNKHWLPVADRWAEEWLYWFDHCGQWIPKYFQWPRYEPSITLPIGPPEGSIWLLLLCPQKLRKEKVTAIKV